MKNKESKGNKSVTSKRNSKKNEENSVNQDDFNRNFSKGPTLSQIDRLKKFYNTTRWLPNSAFTTFFGKPAFENYGYGNTNPVYGGLFYGNYMLSHNINPVDGENIPEFKQVYASSMLKASQNPKSRIPEPPRKVPDEIRNTPDELKGIKGRNPIFQKSNNFPNREIVKPNLIKAKYFRSPKGSPKGDKSGFSKGGGYLNEEFDIEGLLDGRGEFKKKKKILNKKAGGDDFFQKELKKKIVKDQIDNKNPDYLKSLTKQKEKQEKEEKSILKENENEIANIEEPVNINPDLIKEKMKDFYKKMLEVNENEKENEEKKDINQNSTLLNAQNTTQAPEVSFDYKGDSFRTRILKKENPCLIPANEIK